MEYRKTSENLYKLIEFDHSSKFIFFLSHSMKFMSSQGPCGRNILLEQYSTRSHPLRDISRKSPSYQLASCSTGLDIKPCDYQKKESNLEMAVGTFLGSANLINPTGRKSHGSPVTSELDWDQDLDVHMLPDTSSDHLILIRIRILIHLPHLLPPERD